ncbi:MAG: ArdC-like ssDNA-binding domain-containing protein [Candidatus Absconditabacterales bacterium]
MLTEQELMDKGFHNRNHITGRFYTGEKNQITLNQSGFSTHERLTFNQIRKNGYKLRKGSEGIEVVYSEPIEQEDLDSDGNLVIKHVPRLVKHIVFNLEQLDSIPNQNSVDLPALNSTEVRGGYNFIKTSYQNQDKVYGDGMITQKQRLYLIRLIESKYSDERTKAGLLNKVNELSKIEAKQAIARMLEEAR